MATIINIQENEKEKKEPVRKPERRIRLRKPITVNQRKTQITPKETTEDKVENIIEQQAENAVIVEKIQTCNQISDIAIHALSLPMKQDKRPIFYQRLKQSPNIVHYVNNNVAFKIVNRLNNDAKFGLTYAGLYLDTFLN
jgi:hypothetical protein